MRFEVRYPTGTPHEVEIEGTLAILGRDPTADLVLNDVKCSRRHAVVESGPDGLSIRDTDSANGIYVNDRKLPRAKLKEGDLIRLGEVVLKVLPDRLMGGTVSMGVEDLAELARTPGSAPPEPPPAAVPVRPPPAKAVVPPAPPAPPPARPAPPPPTAAVVSRPVPDPPAAMPAPRRTLAVTVLAGLWLASVLLYAGAGVGLALWRALPTPYGLVAAAVALILAGVAAIMAFGLWTMKPWARLLQIAIAAIGLLVCPMTLASATVLVYMLRRQTGLRFSRSQLTAEETLLVEDRSSEMAFGLTILAMAGLGVILSAVSALFVPRPL